MLTFLFWNTNKKRLESAIASMVSQYDVDVIMLAESQIPPSVLLKKLNRTSETLFDYSPQIGCEKIELFTRFPRKFILPVYENYRLTIRNLKLPGLEDMLLAITHFPSKMHWSDSSQAAESYNLSTAIKETEERAEHKRTVLVGDLNMNPFDEGVVNANGLHGVMSRSIAERETRTVQKREYPFFYNPMWNLLGDHVSAPPGTYYYNSSEHRAYFWHNFDQVLVRPELLSAFSNRDLKIITSVEGKSLLNSSGNPDNNSFSDHLPIMFKLSL